MLPERRQSKPSPRHLHSRSPQNVFPPASHGSFSDRKKDEFMRQRSSIREQKLWETRSDQILLQEYVKSLKLWRTEKDAAAAEACDDLLDYHHTMSGPSSTTQEMIYNQSPCGRRADGSTALDMLEDYEREGFENLIASAASQIDSNKYRKEALSDADMISDPEIDDLLKELDECRLGRNDARWCSEGESHVVQIRQESL